MNNSVLGAAAVVGVGAYLVTKVVRLGLYAGAAYAAYLIFAANNVKAAQ